MDFYLLFFGVMLLEVVRYFWNADDTDLTDLHRWVRIIHLFIFKKLMIIC